MITPVPIPPRIARLPRWGDYRVPFFVCWINEGKKAKPQSPGAVPDFRVMDDNALAACIQHRRCWVCGDKLGSVVAFTAGPMSIMQGASAEPPAHRDCAEYAVKVCPFMVNPDRGERRTNVPTWTQTANPGRMAHHNPGVAATYVTRSWRMAAGELTPGAVHIDFVMGPPLSVSWWHRGRPATRQEVVDGMVPGLALMANQMPQDELQGLVDRFQVLLPP